MCMCKQWWLLLQSTPSSSRPTSENHIANILDKIRYPLKKTCLALYPGPYHFINRFIQTDYASESIEQQLIIIK